MDLNTQIALMAAALHGSRVVTFGEDASIEEDITVAKRIWKAVLARERE